MQLWKCFGKMLNNKKIKHNRINSLEINSTKTFDQQKIAEEFNNFFSNIGQNLAKNINNTTHNFKPNLGTPSTIYTTKKS